MNVVVREALNDYGMWKLTVNDQDEKEHSCWLKLLHVNTCKFCQVRELKMVIIYSA